MCWVQIAESRTEGGGALGRLLSFLFSQVYFVIGLVVAASHHYFEHLNAFRPIASAVLAVLLWPLVLFGSTSTSNDREGSSRCVPT